LEHVNYFTIDSLELLMKLHGFTTQEYENASISMTAVFKKNATRANPVQNYFSGCEDYLFPSIQLIDRYFESQKPIVVYGAGSFCQYLFANTRLAECNIIKIVDGNCNIHGLSLGTHSIQPPSVLCDDDVRKADIVIVSYRFSADIIEIIRNMGLKNQIVSLPVAKEEN